MQLRAEQWRAHLAALSQKGLRPLYTLFGDEPLLQQEAADELRLAAKQADFHERKVFTVGAHFDWAEVLGAVGSLSLFADKQLIELRIPTGKPGKEGSVALQQLAAQLAAQSEGQPDVLMLVTLPRLDKSTLGSAWFTALDAQGITLRIDAVERHALPQWIAQRLSRQGQRVQDGEAGLATLAFFAQRIEGNLLAAYQEVQKLGLLYPPGELTLAQVEAAVLNVARYDVFKLSEAMWGGQVDRTLRMLDGLQAEGEPAVLVHWAMAEDIRALLRIRQAQAAGRPLPVALRENRIWGIKEKLFENLLPRLETAQLEAWLKAMHELDGLVKGLRLPHWPREPWAGLRQMAIEVAKAAHAQPARQRFERISA